MSQRGCLLSLTALFCAALDDLWTGFGSTNTHRKCFYCLSFALSPPASNRTKEIVIMNTHNKHKKTFPIALTTTMAPRAPRMFHFTASTGIHSGPVVYDPNDSIE